MIIGINGEINSGKDTVGKIIQWLFAIHNCKNEKIKQTYIEQGFEGFNYEIQSEWRIKKYAAKLKQIASILTGIPSEKFEDQEFKKTILPEQWNENFYDRFNGKKLLRVESTSIRKFLQKLGTEAIRNNIHPNAWVNALFVDYVYMKGVITSVTIKNNEEPPEIHIGNGHPNWIITDTRFPNEAQAIKDRDGIVIRVNRDSTETKWNGNNGYMTTSIPIKHTSETALDNWPFDWIIDNNDSLDVLSTKVKEMLLHFNLLS